MKKVLLPLILSIFCLSAFAEDYKDIIISFTQQIPCKVIDVSDGVVRYIVEMDADRIQRITTSTVRMIVYADGTVVKYNENPQNSVAPKQQPAAQPIAQQEAQPQQTYQQPAPKQETPATDQTYQLIRKNSLSYYYGDRKVTNAEVKQLLSPYSPAYDAWNSANAYMVTGGVFTGLACVSTITGACMIGDPISCISLCATGLVLLIPALTFELVAASKFENSIDMWNDDFVRQQSHAMLELKPICTQSGVGIALCF